MTMKHIDKSALGSGQRSKGVIMDIENWQLVVFWFDLEIGGITNCLCMINEYLRIVYVTIIT